MNTRHSKRTPPHLNKKANAAASKQCVVFPQLGKNPSIETEHRC